MNTSSITSAQRILLCVALAVLAVLLIWLKVDTSSTFASPMMKNGVNKVLQFVGLDRQVTSDDDGDLEISESPFDAVNSALTQLKWSDKYKL